MISATRLPATPHPQAKPEVLTWTMMTVAMRDLARRVQQLLTSILLLEPNCKLIATRLCLSTKTQEIPDLEDRGFLYRE